MSHLGTKADRAFSAVEMEALALSVRRQLWRDVLLLEPLPLGRLKGGPHTFIGPRGVVSVIVRLAPALGRHCWLHTSIDDDDTTRIRCNRASWRELSSGAARTRFGLAHELGHGLLHQPQLRDISGRRQDPVADDDWDLEAQANRFAAHLLAPDAAILLARRSGMDLSPDAISSTWGLSLTTAERRLEEEEVLQLSA